MKKTYLLLVTLLCMWVGASAQLAVEPAQLIDDVNPIGMEGIHGSSGEVTCAQDSLLYGQAKSSGLRGININTATSADQLGQYYDCPQAVTVSGFRFYAWSGASGNPSNTPITLTCALFAAGMDSLPTGSALATATVVVDTNFYGGTLSLLAKDANFSTPVTMNQPYIMTVTTSSSISVAVVTNDWTPGDGAMEWLAPISIAGTWYHPYAINVGGVPFDADFLAEPFVTYDVVSDFSMSPNCLTSAGTVNFTNASSPVLGNRMYNQAAFLDLERLSYSWAFGDASADGYAIDTNHNYAAAGPYTVTLSDTLYGWGTACTDQSSQTIGGGVPNAAFNSSGGSLTIAFTDMTSGGANSWLWDFGDGATSTQQNPSHTYATAGSYTVCLTSTNGCGTDSSCAVLTVGCSAPVAGFSETTSNLTATFTDGSNSATSWLWDFGDGNTSTQQNPSHTYTNPGTYTVCQTVTNSCGTDSTCTTVTVSCPAPGAAFSSSSTNLAYTFTDISSGNPTTWMWDFGDGNTSTQQNPSHTYAATGTYTVCLTITSACGTDSSCTTITVSCPMPAASFNVTPNGLSITCTDMSTNSPTAWAWDFGDGTGTSTQQNPNYTYSSDGTYTVTLVVTNACGMDTTTQPVLVVGMDDALSIDMKIYPNPAEDMLRIDLGEGMSENGVLHIVDPLGRLVRKEQINAGTRQHTTDVSELGNGMYFFRLETESGSTVRRVSVMH